MDKATQRAKILAYCAEHGSITVREATVKLDINSPTKRISEMVNGGYDVQKEDEVRIKDNGRKVRYKRYFISQKKVGET
jgi:predicted ArsR family transcriptional regulator